MSECLVIKKNIENITLIDTRENIVISYGSIENNVCVSEKIVISGGPVEIINTKPQEIKVTISEHITIFDNPALPRAGANLQILGENEEPCDLVISQPQFVLKKVIVDDCVKFKLLVVEPGV